MQFSALKMQSILTFLCALLCFQLVKAKSSYNSQRPVAECTVVGFNDIRSCKFKGNIQPPDEDNAESSFIQSALNAPLALPYYRRIEMVSYFLSGRKQWFGKLFRIRHPVILLKTRNGYDALHISYSNRTLFHIALEESSESEPLTPEQALSMNIQGYKRRFQCYSSAMASDIAAAIGQFSKNGMGYAAFANNCRHFALFILRRLCGKNISRKADRSIFNPVMMLFGESWPFKWRKKRNKGPIPLLFRPIIGMPHVVGNEKELAQIIQKRFTRIK
jgi:hypothetical protein